MNDLPRIFSSVLVRMYVDDTVLFKEIDFKADIREQLGEINKDLDRLGTWCINNKFTINVDKSKGMLFTALCIVSRQY